MHEKLRNRVAIARAILSAERVWLPDVFASIYDVLNVHGQAVDIANQWATTSGRNELDHFLGLHAPPLRDLQGHELGKITPALRAIFIDAIDQIHVERQWWYSIIRCAQGLKAIDEVFRGVDPARGHDAYAYLNDYRAYLARQGSLLTSAGLHGTLLPGMASTGHPPRELGDLFESLVRVQLDEAFVLDYDVVDQVGVGHASPLRIGIVPVVQTSSELEWKVTEKGYQVTLSDAAESALRARVLEALHWLTSSDLDVQIVLLPELVTSPGIVRSLQLWRAAHESPLPRFMLAGSHLVFDSEAPPPGVRNRAFVIDSSGQVIWHQDKMHPYVFTAEHQDACSMKLSEPVIDRQEDICVGPRRLVLRDTGAGERIAVLICEDFARALPYQSAVVQLRVNRILVPVMNGPRPGPNSPGDWIQRYGVSFAQESGAMSLIANSGALVTPNGRDRAYHDYGWLLSGLRRPPRLVASKLQPGTDRIEALVLEP